MQKKTYILLLPAILLLIFIALFFFLRFLENQHHSDYVSLIAPKELNPALSFKDENDQEVLLASYRGKTILLNFWASWCVPCIVEMPTIQKLQEKFRDRDFRVVAVSLDEDFQKAVGNLENKVGALDFIFLKGFGSSSVQELGVQALPHSILIDKSGKLRFAETGEKDWNTKQMQMLVEALL